MPKGNLRKYKLTALLLCSPLFFFAQSLTGLWTGALSNDSNTVRKDQLFEIALTEYRGKVYGYSRSEFIVNDTLYYIVKRVKGTIEGDICEVTDDDIIAYNFRGKLDKGIKVTSTFRRNGNDSAWYLAGTWKTNATKKYYSVTGKVDLGQEKDLSASKIFPHLEELKIADEIAFYKERNQTSPVARIARPQRVKTEYTFNNGSVAAPVVAAPELVRVDPDPVDPDIKKTDPSFARAETKAISSGKTNINVAAPELVRTDPDPVDPGIKKTDASLARTETKNIPAGKTNISVAAPELVRTDPDPVDPGIKKTDASLARTETKNIPAGKTNISVAAPELVRTDPDPVDPDIKKTEQTLARTATPPVQGSTATVKPAAGPQKTMVSQPVASTPNAPAATANKTAPVTSNTNKPVAAAGNKGQATNPVNGNNNTINPPTAGTAKASPGPATVVTAQTNTQPLKTASPATPAVPRKSVEELTRNVSVISGRKSEFSQVVQFTSDSLVLSLYDNGEIDGDTVSVIMNGETIMARQGLKASAIRKTIYVQPGQQDDFTLVLFADNLGKYPPNTGLLVVHDGEDTYHLRFSSDFQKSSGIVFRRKQ